MYINVVKIIHLYTLYKCIKICTLFNTLIKVENISFNTVSEEKNLIVVQTLVGVLTGELYKAFDLLLNRAFSRHDMNTKTKQYVLSLASPPL